MIRFLLLGLLLPCPALAQKVQARLDCRPAGAELVYDCAIRLTRQGKPLSGAQLAVGADMPSMPMAHNVKPVKAKPGRQPGEYLARLELEMHGEWAVKLRLSGPVRDLIVKKMKFE
jgi:hypothetical protein